MSRRKRRKVLRKAAKKCYGNKICYATREQANFAMKEILEEKQWTLRVYYCRHCKAFHLTKNWRK